MKSWFAGLLLFVSAAACAMPLGTNARAVIPAELQQVISVDYRALKNSQSAQALKQQVLPENLKQFEGALKGIGIDTDKELEQLTFAAYRASKGAIQIVGVAQGQFAYKAVMKRMTLKKIKPTMYHNSNLYPMGNGMLMTFLDDFTLLFGNQQSVQGALDARDGYSNNLDSNSTMADMMSSVDAAPVWSILDQQGTQTMMRSALGDASKIADYETVKKRLLGSRYTMNFQNGVNFDLSVLTSDSMTAATLSSLVKAGMMYKKMNATATEKMALDSVTVDSDSSNLQLHFRSDDQRFQSLLHSDLFAAVSH
ncbi:MAG TPA: hypothetical protein VFJ47_11100 [Terriglobales bacterium]|nr:hypothetical protein [Terriglobales bacterium]